MLKRTVLAFMVLLVIILGSGYCAEILTQRDAIKHVTGEVWNVDWVAGKFVIRSMGFTKVDEITFTVSQDTQITRGTSVIAFTDIDTTDRVEVDYYSSLAGLKAVRIIIQE